MPTALLLFLLAFVSFLAWFVSMLVGGGSPLVLIPLVTLLLGAQSVAPVLTVGSVLGNAQRSALLWAHIDWTLTLWQVPGVVAGSVLGAYAFTKVEAQSLQVLVAIALIYMVLHIGLKNLISDRLSLPALSFKSWHFLPLGFGNAIVSGLVGSTGPLLNPAYLSYGLEKERMIATRAASLTLTHIVKMMTYAALGVLSPTLIGYGLLIGCAALPANWLGRIVLEKMSAEQFQIAVFSFIGFSGVWMLWQRRALLTH